MRAEALVGNDYRADVVGLQMSNNRAKGFEARFQARNLSAVPRSRSNVRDLSNLVWVTMDVGVFTGLNDRRTRQVGDGVGAGNVPSVLRPCRARTAHRTRTQTTPRQA